LSKRDAPVTEVRLQIAHQAVENTRRLDTAREKGKTHLDDPPQDFTFDDFLDIINPLQHLPLVSVLYRAFTGDEIKPAMRILGDIAYGGPTGFMSSCAQVLFEKEGGLQEGERPPGRLRGVGRCRAVRADRDVFQFFLSIAADIG
jgi:hypothetical protein